jgi:hypothetical protein
MVTQKRPSDWDPSHHAPGRLELIRLFANTVDLYRGRDLLADVDQASLTLRTLGLLADGERFGEGELEQARGFRAAVRSVFVDDQAAPGTGLPALEFRVVFNGVRRIGAETTGTGLWGRLTDLSVELLVADRTGQLSRLKACANPQCRWLFWDASRPGTGRWCSMRVCGGQHKARSYRARQGQTA